MPEDTLDSLAEARGKLESVLEALQPLVDAGIDSDGEMARIAARLERMAAEVTRIEGVVAKQAVGLRDEPQERALGCHARV